MKSIRSADSGVTEKRRGSFVIAIPSKVDPATIAATGNDATYHVN